MRTIQVSDMEMASNAAELNKEERMLLADLLIRWMDDILTYRQKYDKVPMKQVSFEKIIKAALGVMTMLMIEEERPV